jgi:hypothetical protein
VPTHEELAHFLRDFATLTGEQQQAFKVAVRLFFRGLAAQPFSPRLRVKRVAGHPGVWELTWAPNGRATFEYGPEVNAGDPHIIWRRVGTHDISGTVGTSARWAASLIENRFCWRTRSSVSRSDRRDRFGFILDWMNTHLQPERVAERQKETAAAARP